MKPQPKFEAGIGDSRDLTVDMTLIWPELASSSSEKLLFQLSVVHLLMLGLSVAQSMGAAHTAVIRVHKNVCAGYTRRTRPPTQCLHRTKHARLMSAVWGDTVSSKRAFAMKRFFSKWMPEEYCFFFLFVIISYKYHSVLPYLLSLFAFPFLPCYCVPSQINTSKIGDFQWFIYIFVLDFWNWSVIGTNLALPLGGKL